MNKILTMAEFLLFWAAKWLINFTSQLCKLFGGSNLWGLWISWLVGLTVFCPTSGVAVLLDVPVGTEVVWSLLFPTVMGLLCSRYILREYWEVAVRRASALRRQAETAYNHLEISSRDYSRARSQVERRERYCKYWQYFYYGGVLAAVWLSIGTPEPWFGKVLLGYTIAWHLAILAVLSSIKVDEQENLKNPLL